MKLNKTWILPALLVLALVQLAVPIGMIVRRELTLREGKAFRFRTAPVDPYDAFRGKYVALAIEPQSVAVKESEKYVRGQPAYAVLAPGTNGFATVVRVEPRRPAVGDYIAVRAEYDVWAGGQLRLRWPFDRYYLNERDAPRAEQAYREHSRGGARDAYVQVRVKNGFAVLEELYVGGKPVAEALKP